MSDRDRIADAEFGCPYFPAYSGRCNGMKGASGYCIKHTEKKCCVCGDQAVRECNHTGQFVCGYPLCRNCEGFTDDKKSGGTWGFMNHGHRVKPSVQSERDRREMVASDIGVEAIIAAAGGEG